MRFAATLLTAVLVSVGAVGGSGPQPAQLRPSDDFQALQGVWLFVKAEQHGKVLAISTVQSLTIRGNMFTSTPPTPYDNRFALAFGGVMRVTHLRAAVPISSTESLYRVRGDVL